jgi:hypothetical protein
METIQDSHNHPAPQAGNVASDTMKSERIHKIMNGSETASSLVRVETITFAYLVFVIAEEGKATLSRRASQTWHVL